MRNSEIAGIISQVAEPIKGMPGIPVGKKLMLSDDNEEFIQLVISFAEKKAMTISNIKNAIQEAVNYMEDNATLTAVSNEEMTQVKKYCAEEVVTKLSKIITQSAEPDDRMPAVRSQISEMFSVNVRKDEKLAREIYNMILESYSRSGISIQEALKILRMTEKMFEYTLILPNDDNQQD